MLYRFDPCMTYIYTKHTVDMQIQIYILCIPPRYLRSFHFETIVVIFGFRCKRQLLIHEVPRFHVGIEAQVTRGSTFLRRVQGRDRLDIVAMTWLDIIGSILSAWFHMQGYINIILVESHQMIIKDMHCNYQPRNLNSRLTDPFQLLLLDARGRFRFNEVLWDIGVIFPVPGC